MLELPHLVFIPIKIGNENSVRRKGAKIMKSLKKASTFTPLAGPVSTKAPGAAFPPPGPRAPTGPAQAARTSCGKG